MKRWHWATLLGVWATAGCAVDEAATTELASPESTPIEIEEGRGTTALPRAASVATTDGEIGVRAEAVVTGGFTTSFDDTFRGGGVVYATASLAGREDAMVNTTASLVLAGIPAGARVERALLYWVISGGTDNTATVNSSSVTGTQLVMGGSTCWGVNNTSYRADVTALVTGNATYTVGGLPSSTAAASPDTDGVSLVVVYSRAATTARRVTVRDGLITASGAGDLVADTFATLSVPSPAAGNLAFFVGDGQAAADGALEIGGVNRGTSLWSGSTGSLVDHRSFDVSAVLTGTSLGWRQTLGNDCLAFAYGILDTNAAVVTIAAPITGSTVGPNFPLSGSCNSGRTVTVTDGTATVCTQTCTANAFSCILTGQANGSHTYAASQTLPSLGDQVTVTVDSVPPTVPVINTPAAGARLNTLTPTISGSCESGSTVTVREGGSTLCAVPCASSAFSCAPTMTEGAHTVFAFATDPSANVSSNSDDRSFTLDVTPPGAPTITAPTSGALINTATPSIGGACETGARVTVHEGALVVCATDCVASAYSCAPATALAQGPHTVTATQVDVAGNPSLASTPSMFTIDSIAPSAPTIAQPTEGAFVATRTPLITGACETGSTVSVREGAAVLCNAPCVALAYSCASATIAEGPHMITARASDTAGNVSADSAPRNFTVDVTVPSAPTVTAPANGSFVNTRRPEIAGAVRPTPSSPCVRASWCSARRRARARRTAAPRPSI